MLHNARPSPRRPKSSSPDSSVSDTSKHQVGRCVRTLGIRRALPAVASTGVFRRIYGKDNRVLHTAELSQSLKVGTHSRARQGAGIFTGSTKIGVTGFATLHGEAEIEPSEAATRVVRKFAKQCWYDLLMALDIQEGADGVLRKTQQARSNHASCEIDTATLSTADNLSRSRSIP
jgi:hypothetical protein